MNPARVMYTDVHYTNTYRNTRPFILAHLLPRLPQDLEQLCLVAGLQKGLRALHEVLIERRPDDRLAPMCVNRCVR